MSANPIPHGERCRRCANGRRLPGFTACETCIEKSRVRHRRYIHVDVELRCGSCGAVETYALLADDIEKVAIAKARCLFCRERAMSKEPRKVVG